MKIWAKEALMWNRFDNFMQGWYNSMGHPKNTIVMSFIGCGVGIIVVLVVFT